MQRYLVIWHYIANHGMVVVNAESHYLAAQHVYDNIWTAPEFKERATIYVAPLHESRCYKKGEEWAIDN